MAKTKSMSIYHVHEDFQNRDWIVLAKNKKEAQRLVLEELTDADDYPDDGEWEFDFEKSESGFEVTAKAQIEPV